MLQTALALISKGLRIFPCGVAGKVPVTPHGVKDASIDPEIIRAWWERGNFNIGIACGKISNIFVLDVDDEAVLAKLEAAYGNLPETVEALTGKGRHVYFRMPEFPIANSAGKIGKGLDIRGDGGYVIAPPSIHPSGRKYTWSVDCAPSFAEAPQWLLEKITGRANGNGNNKAPASPSEWQALMIDGVDDGQRDCSAARLAGYFLRHRIDPLVTLEILQLWNSTKCRPPLPDTDIVRIVNSIAGAELKRRGLT